jgi:hypothetical protein
MALLFLIRSDLPVDAGFISALNKISEMFLLIVKRAHPYANAFFRALMFIKLSQMRLEHI